MGDEGAMFNLGVIAVDPAKRRAWFEKAANKGNSDAMFNLGVCSGSCALKTEFDCLGVLLDIF